MLLATFQPRIIKISLGTPKSQCTQSASFSHLALSTTKRNVCVCLSLVTFLHYCTDTDVTLGMTPSCALLDGFAIGAWISLLWQHTRQMRNVSEDASLAAWMV